MNEMVSIDYERVRERQQLPITADPKLFMFDNWVENPLEYRASVLRQDFSVLDYGATAIFKGIAHADLASPAILKLKARHPDLTPTLSMFRKSPFGQVEPNFVHCDIGLGDWTAILYLNPNPPPGDGTDFWQHQSGSIAGTPAFAVSAFKKPGVGTVWRHVEGKFNRLLLFSADLFHSRSIFDNYGAGDDARLLQLIFGEGKL